MKGLFITFEGSEGSGKSTQSKLLYRYLKRQGLPMVYIREPGSTKIGEKVRRILLDKRNKGMSMVAETLLYMASRAQLVEEIILPSLRQGKIVICDRFLDSTLAYQGYGAGLDLDTIRRIGHFATCGVKPDFTLFLDVNTKDGLRRTGKHKDRIELRPISYHERVRRGYLALARREPSRIKIVKVNHLKLETQRQIRKLVSQVLCRFGI